MAGAPDWIGVEVGATVGFVLEGELGVDVGDCTTIGVDEATGVLDGDGCAGFVGVEEGVASGEDVALDEGDAGSNIGLGEDGVDGDDDG